MSTNYPYMTRALTNYPWIRFLKLAHRLQCYKTRNVSLSFLLSFISPHIQLLFSALLLALQHFWRSCFIVKQRPILFHLLCLYLFNQCPLKNTEGSFPCSAEIGLPFFHIKNLGNTALTSVPCYWVLSVFIRKCRYLSGYFVFSGTY